jgi:hypothetical protein
MESYVIGVDVGIQNLGLTVFSYNTGQVVHWDCVALCTSGKYIPSKNVEYVINFLKRYECFFSSAVAILVERQMRTNMRIIESVIQALYYDRTTIVNARSIKLHYGLSMKNYKLNKAAAIVWARAFTEANPSAFAPGVSLQFDDSKKRDDLADSLLIVMYYLDTYSNQLPNNHAGFIAPNVQLAQP